ncbi:MAG: hypothetical protein ACKVPJ_06825 [Chitinophagales bacterium]
MNRTTHYFLACFCLFYSCTSQKGTVEIDTLSKKVFESLRDDDFGGLREIIPNESGFEKILALQGKDDNGDVEKQFDAFLIQCETDFKAVRSNISDWYGSTYLNTNSQTAKEESVTFSSVTTKFKQGEVNRKISFTAAKIGGRWFYYADLKLHEKDHGENNMPESV